MGVVLTQIGDFHNTEHFLKKSLGNDWVNVLHSIAQEGVENLRNNTPKDTGLTSESWSYEIIQGNGLISVTWKNSNVNNGVNIAMILQYGHATGNGGYVYGIDYINPALRPVFEKLAEAGWREVTKV